MISFVPEQNVSNVRQLIRMKQNSGDPLAATAELVKRVRTDYDHFPYQRWFRGRYNSSIPIIAEREAGFRVRNDACYDGGCGPCGGPCCAPTSDNMPQLCFQVACSTTLPCAPQECVNFYR